MADWLTSEPGCSKVLKVFWFALARTFVLLTRLQWAAFFTEETTVMHISPEARNNAQNLLDFIDVSPSPWHAVACLEGELLKQQFVRLQENERWALRVGGRYYVIRGDSSLIAFVIGHEALPETGIHMLGAHTDSPGLRLKPRAPHATDNMARLGVEIYGSPILATFTDRDLSLAGRLSVRSGSCLNSRLIRFPRPLVRLPNLAIHMNRAVNEEGLKFNKQTELPLLLGTLASAFSPQEQFLALLAEEAGVEEGEIVTWELQVYDTHKGTFWGAHQEFVADSQIDNLASCHAGMTALLAAQSPAATCLCGFFDHEEVGSESAKGAQGSFLSDVTERIARAVGLDWEGYRQSLANSFLISVDMAHAFQPNFPSAYEPQHHVQVNGGPVIKTNVNQRYATDSCSEAQFINLCERVNVPYQQYAHRTDLGCGSTIGPIIGSRLGVRTVDVGNPMWAMHSIRESAGVVDHTSLIHVLTAFFS